MSIFTSHSLTFMPTRSFLIRLILLAVVIISYQQTNAQIAAFPGAEGAGKYTSGGRGTASLATTVFEVTNLNDDNNPGSLRYALSQTATYRTIVFRVSGTIHLNSKLTIKGNTTIAGQTAPGDGICIADYPTVINGDNVIVRYMRFRMGDKNQNLGMVNGSGGDDSFGNLGNKNIIIDHCTSSWSSDEALSIYRGDSLTIQWSFITEPLNYSYHFETGDTDFEEHGYGGIWGGRHASFHHNLIAHIKGRGPRFDGSRNLSPFTPGQENADFRNNVIYNWASYNVNGGEGGNYNIVNNYFKYGPSTSSGNSSGVPIRYMVINPGKQTSSPVLPYGQYYVNGNYVDGSVAITANNWLGAAMSGGSQADTSQAKVSTPFSMEPVTTHSAQEAYNLVLQYGGASFARDTLDQRIVNDVMNRTGRLIDVQGGYPHGTPYASTVNAWPTLNSTTAPTDTDHDGMPDAYETANGLNINDPADRNGIAANGYTNLENYLNSLVDAPRITATGTMNAFTQNIPAPSSIQHYTLSAYSLTNDVTITPPVPFEVSADGGITWHGNASPLTVTQSSGTVSPKMINVRLNASAAGPYSGNITNASNGATTLDVPVTGTAYQSTAPPGTALVVAKDGSGDYTTVQAAINAAPVGLTAPFIIFIKNGQYYEKITVPSNKPFIHLVGESVANVLLYYDDGASDPLPGGGTVGTQNSASFTVGAPDFAAFNITFANTYGDGSQAVAVLVNNDRAIFKNCRFLGNQDTLYIKGGGTPRQYFKDCYIDGNVDFIFGSSIAVFDSTTIYAKTRSNTSSSYLTAANTTPGQANGFVFRDCAIPDNTGGTQYVLGRPWQNSTGFATPAENKVVWLNARMSGSIKPEGWAVWDAGTNTNIIYYGEYQSRLFNGNPVDISQRVPWSKQLNATEAATYTNANLFGAWDPCAVSSLVCTNEPRDIAIANFRGVKGASNSTFDWNISWAKDQIKYELFRSATRASGFTKIGELTATNDSSVNFQLTDVIPAVGTSYFYYLVGSKTGYASHVTDTLEISSMPAITTTGTVQAFGQNLGTPSAAQTISVSGDNLLGDIVITPPANFDISSNGGTTWVSNPAAVNLTPTANLVGATNIMIRLNAAAAGTYTDSLVLTTNSGETKYVMLTGTTADGNAPNYQVLQLWPFTTNANDSADVRATGVLPSTPTLNNLYVSNGTTITTPTPIPAYSSQFGQAFGASADGSGMWGTAIGGPGGTLQRIWYEQFTVTADNGYQVRVDSIYVTGAFYNTSSNTRLAVVYSKDGFVNDSTDVFSIPGGFANPISLPNQTAGPSATFPLSVAGIGGATLQPGETLSFRFYFSCSSSSAGRYGMIKDVKVVGESVDINTLPGVLQHWPFSTDGNDSEAVRSPGVTASTPTLNNLYLSNGTQVPAIPAYSAQYGQAFGATADGSGAWGSSAGGPGGTLQRMWYEQFTVTAENGYRVRVDSIFATAAFYQTSSNTKLAVVYSRDGFVNDSSDVSSIPGGFANPIALANQSGGPTNTYSLAVNGIDGVTINPGEKITFRFYFSCSSSSLGRYGMMKDVKVYGLSTDLSTIPGVIQHWPFTTDGNDSASVRSAGVTPSTPTLNNLYLSNGTQVPAIPAYSAQYGQAFGATANGSGAWGTSSGGPGGTLQRSWYEQFTVTAKSSYEVRIDSLFATAAFYQTSSNTKLAVVYSLSNFIADSADVTSTGSFANPIALANQSAGPTNRYAIEVAGTNGLVLQPGQTATFRFYFSCSSSSLGRYGMLKDVQVFGLATNVATPIEVLQHWPFSTDGNDSVAVRSPGVTPSTPTLHNLYLSNGTQVPAIPAYSAQYGQAFGATPDGSGAWGSSAGGPGGTLQRSWYEQFTVTANGGYSVRVDSLRLTSAFYQTSSNTKLAVVYSLSNFVSDSADVTSQGSFANPIALANQSGGPTNEYAIELAGTTGITLLPGQTLTLRFYFSCSSSSLGRYGMLKDVKVIGSANSTGGPVPTVLAAGTLGDFTQIIGSPSSVQTYTVSGADLLSDITVTPPLNYEISDDGGTTWYTNSNPLVIPQSGGLAANTTISVRLNASALGNYSGNITHTSLAANTVNLAVNGNTVPVPVITATSTLNNFSHTVGVPSAPQAYTISGTGILDNITITPPANFEVSGDGGVTWKTNTSPLVIASSGGMVANTSIDVRMNAAAAGNFSGNIVHVSTGAASVDVPVNGTAIPAPLITVNGTLSGFTQILGTASAVQTYTVQGDFLTGNITLTAPADYEISADGGTTWFSNASPLTLVQSGGSVPATTISVRLNAASTGAHAGNIVHVSSGTANKTVPVSGLTLPKPLITVTANLTGFDQTLGSPSVTQSYTVSGQNLTDNITVTPPAKYEISANGGITWQTTAVTLVRANGSVAPTTILVRLNAAFTGFYSGNIIHSSTNAATVNLQLNGVTTVNAAFKVYPVPAHNTIYLAHPITTERALLTLFNATGQKAGSLQTQPNTIETPVDISRLSGGIYFLQYELGGKKVILRFMRD
ncbi:MAG: T9SS type A sorting domain-containing protein [Terrimonas sp.]|nr:T9SS type A sorting domain-containing protein [Terrimonas sp.]